ncbi:MAG: glycosyltransferase [Phycisphaerae bacterium]
MSRDNRPVIVHVVHSLEGGGTERTLVALLHAFDPSRFRHAVVTLRAAGSLSARLPDHVACRPLVASGRSWSTGLRLAQLTRHWGAAVIHARNTGCWSDATGAGLLTPHTRLVLGFHGLETAGPFNQRHRRLARWALLAGARFTSVSEAGRRQLRDQARIPTDRITLLRNGVELHSFGQLDEAARKRTRAAFQWDDTTFVVGTVGSLTPVKGHITLIRAVARVRQPVPNIRLLIVGDGPQRASLEQQAQVEGVGDRVHFLGWREDVSRLMDCMDVYVCSSASEGMNNALLEAMAAGLPIIATDVGDNAAMIRDGVEGQIVKPGSFEAIANTLAIFARSPDLRQRFATAAKTRANDYDFDEKVRAYEAYYQALLTVGTTNEKSVPHGRSRSHVVSRSAASVDRPQRR